MRLVTWNINSLRLRLPSLARVVRDLRPDVVCLQETKVSDDLFPLTECQALGFDHIQFRGQKSYNGVAILSRYPLTDVRGQDWAGNDDRRHLAVRVAGFDLHCLYVPAGGDIPDPEQNPKFAHKLRFLDELAAFYGENPAKRRILVGDFNIAPLETDVWSHKQLLKVVSHTPVEVDKLDRWQRAAGFVDAMREIIPPQERLYTWWSYRSPDWQKNDRGRRLDHVWVSPDLKDDVQSCQVMRDCRSWDQPSDHVPVLVELKECP